MRILDSHLHLWDPSVLAYDWLEGDLNAPFAAAELAEDRIEDVQREAAVFVQADPRTSQALDEVRWVDSIAEETGVIGIVAGARLHKKRTLRDHLDALGEYERVVGIRHLLQGEPDGFALRRAFVEGASEIAARGLTFDACVRAHQIPDVTALADAVPDLRIVLDHLGKPAIGTSEDPLPPSVEWVRDLCALAERPQVMLKLSGLPAESSGHIDEDQMVPFLDAALEAFGADRLMWGSDWPVSSVDSEGDSLYFPGNRDDWCHTIADWARERGADVDGIMWGNAARFYRLPAE
ncbi:amidohydrolase family protein [uncultured Microbacterium sp.]|uniref:amidohydrolase family protein n=1 Tax=uncultured Microbacterium sp. TaxID=191216 RepID=UPI002614C785|nr:amidohydrolase family protein [uncultured Microbacterium sp.]